MGGYCGDGPAPVWALREFFSVEEIKDMVNKDAGIDNDARIDLDIEVYEQKKLSDALTYFFKNVDEYVQN